MRAKASELTGGICFANVVWSKYSKLTETTGDPVVSGNSNVHPHGCDEE